MPQRQCPDKGKLVFYEPKVGHGLLHTPFNAIVTPRPIGWISTRGSDGFDNLAPYSFFNATAYVPPQVMFASTSAKPDRGDTKDSLALIRETEVFCVNVVATAMQDAMNAASGAYAANVDEFELSGLDKIDCETITCSRVAGVPAALECQMTQIIQQKGEANFLVMGEVAGVFIDDAYLVDGKLDPTRFHPLARMGYRDYASVKEVFELKRPDEV